MAGPQACISAGPDSLYDLIASWLSTLLQLLPELNRAYSLQVNILTRKIALALRGPVRAREYSV